MCFKFKIGIDYIIYSNHRECLENIYYREKNTHPTSLTIRHQITK